MCRGGHECKRNAFIIGGDGDAWQGSSNIRLSSILMWLRQTRCLSMYVGRFSGMDLIENFHVYDDGLRFLRKRSDSDPDNQRFHRRSDIRRGLFLRNFTEAVIRREG